MTQQEIFAPGESIPDANAQALQMQQLDALANLMDSAFVIPGTKITVGLDAVIGLLPVVGDTLSVLVSSYIVKEAHRLGVPGHVKLRMGGNIFMDWLIGLVPLAGDLFDIGWKANRKNVELIRRHIAKR